MKTHQRPKAAAIGALVALLVACNGDEPDGPTLSSSGPTSNTTSTSSAAATSAAPTPEEVATQQILAFVPTYFSTLNEVVNDPTLPLIKLQAVTAGNQYDSLAATYAQYHAAGVTFSGQTVLVRADVGAIDLTNPAQSTAQVSTCIDISAIDGTDPAGNSVVAEGRADFFTETLTLTSTTPGDPAAWRVTKVTNAGAPSC